jgi:hypothetical protein
MKSDIKICEKLFLVCHGMSNIFNSKLKNFTDIFSDSYSHIFPTDISYFTVIMRYLQAIRHIYRT